MKNKNNKKNKLKLSKSEGSFFQPIQYYVLKYMFELLKERYSTHEELLQRITQAMPKNESERFLKMSVDLYELGYQKAIADYKEEFEKFGMHVKIVPEQ